MICAKVYRINGNQSGTYSFDLNDWETGSGGTWQHWGVNTGNFTDTIGTAVNCNAVAREDELEADVHIHPNPTNGPITVRLPQQYQEPQIVVRNYLGQRVPVKVTLQQQIGLLDISELPPGQYFIEIRSDRQ